MWRIGHPPQPSSSWQCWPCSCTPQHRSHSSCWAQLGFRHWGCSSWAPRRHPPSPSPAPVRRYRGRWGPSAGNGQAAQHNEPPSPLEKNKEETRLFWILPTATLVHSCYGGCCLQWKDSVRFTEKGISVWPSHPTQKCHLPSPPCGLLSEDMNMQQVQNTPERPLTSNVTLGFQFSFCLALVQSPCRKSCREERCDQHPPSPPRWTSPLPTLTRQPLEDKIFLFKTQF